MKPLIKMPRRSPALTITLSALVAGCAADTTVEHSDETAPSVVIGAAREWISHCQDADATLIDARPTQTTIADICDQTRPADLAADCSTLAYQGHRIAPFEFKVWRVRATLLRIVLRPDGDLYLVLSDGKGREIVAEAPPPSAIQGARFQREAEIVFDKLRSTFGPRMAPSDVGKAVVVEGVGFFGKASSKEGAPHNGARLMPILKFSLN